MAPPPESHEKPKIKMGPYDRFKWSYVAIIKGKFWVPLGSCPIKSLHNWYMLVYIYIYIYIYRVLSHGYPTFPFDTRSGVMGQKKDPMASDVKSWHGGGDVGFFWVFLIGYLWVYLHVGTYLPTL